MEEIMKRVVGINITTAALPADLEEDLVRALVRARLDFQGDPETHLRGVRFGDDAVVIMAISGTYTPDEVRTNPDDAARAGLIWAAEVDYHYAFEKEYE
jgi:hypothetical protein